MIGSSSQIRHALINTLQVVKYMQKFSENHSHKGLIVRNFISGDLQLEESETSSTNKISQSIQRCLSNITTIVRDSFGHAGIQ